MTEVTAKISGSPDLPEPINPGRTIRVVETEFGALVDDEVRLKDGSSRRHVRWRAAQAGVVVIPRRGDKSALIPIYRYALGTVSLEFPRGCREEGESAQDAAGRELLEETGLRATSFRHVGVLHADTGFLQDSIDVLVAETMPDRVAEPHPDAMESIARARWFTTDGMRETVAHGRISCALTLAALALVRREAG
jgi:ADP-ribose pyrophosphatase